MVSNDDWQEVPVSPQPSPAAPETGLGAWLKGTAAQGKALTKQHGFDSDKYTQELLPAMASAVPGGKAAGDAMKWAAEKTGLSKVPGWLMEKAVGLRKSIPGAGDELISQGVRGTKSSMLGQISQKLPQAEAQVQKAVGSLEAPVDSVAVANKVSESLGPRMTSGGKVVSGAEDQVEEILARAKEIAARGDVSAKEALELARGAQKNSFTLAKGEMKPGLRPELGQAEGGGYKDILKEMSPDVAQGLKTERALIEARKGLERPSNEGVTSQLLRLLGRGGPGAAIGSAVGGPVGGAIGGASGYAATSPLGMSMAAHGAQKAGTAAVATADPLSRLLLSKQTGQLPTSSPNTSSEQDDWQEVK